MISRSRLVIGVDGAASHLAAAFGGKRLTLFFQTDPPRTHPRLWHYPDETSVALANQPTPGRHLTADEVSVAALRLWRQ